MPHLYYYGSSMTVKFWTKKDNEIRQVAIMQNLRPHPNVVLFLGLTFPPDPLALITEFCEGQSVLYRCSLSHVTWRYLLTFVYLSSHILVRLHRCSELFHRVKFTGNWTKNHRKLRENWGENDRWKSVGLFAREDSQWRRQNEADEWHSHGHVPSSSRKCGKLSQFILNYGKIECNIFDTFLCNFSGNVKRLICTSRNFHEKIMTYI